MDCTEINETALIDIGKSQLLPAMVDCLADAYPDQLWMSVQLADKGTFLSINYRSLANAVNFGVHWLKETLGEPKDDSHPVVAYIGPPDIRYYFIVLALVKLGYSPYLISYLHIGYLHTGIQTRELFRITQCKLLLHGYDGADEAPVDLSTISRCACIPNLKRFIDTPHLEPVRFIKTFEEGQNLPLVILETSATTSWTPKPVQYTLGSLAALGAELNASAPSGLETEMSFRKRAGKRRLSTFLPCHTSGIHLGFVMAIYGGMEVVLPDPSKWRWDTPLIASIIESGSVCGAFLHPCIVEDLAHDIKYHSIVEKLTYIFTGGAALSPASGNLLCSKTTLINMYGSSETGFFSELTKPDPADWEYVRFNPLRSNPQFRPVEGLDNTYEAVVVRHPTKLHHTFLVKLDAEEWRTRDTFVPHPDPNKKGYWKYKGRTDDMLSFNTGTSFNPICAEATITGMVPELKGTLFVGNGKSKPGVILEPREECDISTESSQLALVERVWSVLDCEFNETAHLGIKVQRDLMMVASPDKPFPRTSKGSIRRGVVEMLYEHEICEMYQRSNGT